MNQKEFYCSKHKNEKFQYFCLKEECIQQKPTNCQIFYCSLCFEELDDNNQILNHKIYDINILNKKNKKNIFKNKQAVGDKLWQMIKQKYDGSLENFENDCRQINQEFNEIKQKQIDWYCSLIQTVPNQKFKKQFATTFVKGYNSQTQTNCVYVIGGTVQGQQEVTNQIQTDLDQISAQEAYNNQRSQIEINNNNQQDQQQQMDFDENNIKLLNFQQINYSAELGIQINNKIREFQDYMNQLLQVCQSQSQPLNQTFQNNLEISQQVQQLIHQQQFNQQQQNNLQQQIQSINNQKKLIKQYTDSVKFFEDFPALNNQQQYKKLSKSQINTITDLRVQLGYYFDLKNRIDSYGYNSLGKQGIKEINEIIFSNLELKNLQNLSLNYNNSNLGIQEYLQMINQLGSWQLTPQIRKLSLGQEQLKEFNFYLFNLEKLKINLSFCYLNDEKLSKISEQIALLGVCMPKFSFLEIYLQGNKEITDEGINTFSQTLANSSLLKNLRTISLNFNQIENVSDGSLIQLSEILVRKGKNLDALYLYIQTTSVSSLGVKRISEILCKKQLQKLFLDFSFNGQLNGQEIIDVAKAITQTKIINLTGQLNQTFFHQNLIELSIKFTYNPSEQQMLEFFDILTNNKYFPSLSSLQIDAYNNKLNDDNFRTIWNNLTNPQSLTKLKYLYLCLAGSISPESQVLASLKIAQTSKFQNLEELLLSYESSRLNKQVNNRSCAVNIVQNLVNSENLRKLKHLSLDFQNNDLKAEGCQQVVEELSKPKNKLSLEEISLSFWNNGVEENQCQELNSQFRNSLITEQLRVANIHFGIV
ncbi:hypothetical protein PPERSA_09216 [Pseudocohnilembus persalinus]|uniref:Kinase domain protein n=1 Tax=Pseudocohnilembus persalinus TaxID=266149 RepID=A0A0V0R4C3_PSEPJ|nr:hypothetical protein PPERSA_09216 [Pseudocohnilembus persalinus]|eukprot:KRX09332.1 hypothetical protein PPERSA_09216 [Pseudocohnilembus persalinus]